MANRGDLIGERYKVESIIGEGSTSFVYIVTDVFLSVAFAMKEYKEGFEAVSDHEAFVLAQLNGTFFPKIHDVINQNKKKYIVMELIEGERLDEFILNKRADEFAQKEILISLIDNISILHSRDNPIVYNDLKPSNIIVTKDYKVRFVDAASCVMYTHDEEYCFVTDCYSSENARIGKIDFRNDIYAFGLIMIYVFAGVDPASFDKAADRKLLECLKIKGNKREVIMDCIGDYKDISNISLNDIRGKLLSCFNKAFFNKELFCRLFLDIWTVCGLSLGALGLYNYFWRNDEYAVALSMFSLLILIPLFCIMSLFNQSKKLTNIRLCESLCFTDAKDTVLGGVILLVMVIVSFTDNKDGERYIKSIRLNENTVSFARAGNGLKSCIYNNDSENSNYGYCSINGGPLVKLNSDVSLIPSRMEPNVPVSLYYE